MPSIHIILMISSVLCLLVGLVLLVLPVAATILLGLYADAVDAMTGRAVVNTTHVLNAPKGPFSFVAGVLGNHVVLDMGDGQDGMGDLRVTYRGLLLGSAINVEFLDANHQLIATSLLNVVGLGFGSSDTGTVVYPDAPTPYRYVRLVALARQYEIDAVEARIHRLSPNGARLSDEWELRYSLSPLGSSSAHCALIPAAG